MSVNQISPTPGKRTAEEAGKFFRYMSEFIQFNEEDAKSIHQSAPYIDIHLPAIISDFYVNLLKHPQTRRLFLKEDGTLDEEYLKLRMYHQANFWRRTASGVYDDEYAGFVDYVGRAHTSRGADRKIYIDEHYVIGMVGFVQHAIIDALFNELDDYDKDLEFRAIKAWNKLCIIILEMLTRAYRENLDFGSSLTNNTTDVEAIQVMSIASYEKSLGLHRQTEYQDVFVAYESEVPEGERKIIQTNGISVGVFNHKGNLYAIQNSCLHRGGPVATGKLVDDNIICPWHGYTYNLTDGRLLIDPSAHLEIYEVSIKDGMIYITIPVSAEFPTTISLEEQNVLASSAAESCEDILKKNEFFITDIPPGRMRVLNLHKQRVVVYNVNGEYYATAEECTHAGGPLSEGIFRGEEIVCPWHDSCFKVTTGVVTCPPADEPLELYKVEIDGIIGRVAEIEWKKVNL